MDATKVINVEEIKEVIEPIVTETATPQPVGMDIKGFAIGLGVGTIVTIALGLGNKYIFKPLANKVITAIEERKVAKMMDGIHSNHSVIYTSENMVKEFDEE